MSGWSFNEKSIKMHGNINVTRSSVLQKPYRQKYGDHPASSIRWVMRLFTGEGGERQGCVAHHSPPSSVKVKDERNYVLLLPFSAYGLY